MIYEYETEVGTFIAFNRDEDKIEEVEMMEGIWYGPGCWHFAMKDEFVYRWGYRTAKEARFAMEEYAFAIMYEQGWKPPQGWWTPEDFLEQG